MKNAAKLRAEKQFAGTQKMENRALIEKEEAQQERAELVANLRALRLTKEAADKKTAEKAAAAKAAAKNKMPSRLPQAHRR